ncbi:MAG: SGNH/GDSL hydrolase family protein [Clostridia bacterium]|nr:SGNH/GDSL hydrolase family protein [Clostridia bacterium]
MIFNDWDRIVFAGDSVTDRGSQCPVGESWGDNLGHGYVRMIENLLTACYPDLHIRITNSGVSGNTTRDLLARFDRDVVSLNPQWVSICIGINDVWRQFDCPCRPDGWVLPDEYRENVEKMILAVKDAVKGVFLLTPYYIEDSPHDAMRNRMLEYVAICKELAQKHGCVLVDFQAMYERFLKHRHSACIAWDRVHPNEMGAMMMAKEFLKHCDFEYDPHG